MQGSFDSMRKIKDEDPKVDPNVIDIEKIKSAITFAQDHFKTGQNSKHVVLFWGYSGTGKSTSIITLNGQQMYAYNRKGTPILVNRMSDEEKQENEDKGKIVIFIETKIVSGTVYPAVLPLKQFKSDQESVSMWDTPGFGDNKGITQILINTYFIHRIFNIQKQIKLIFTINFNDLSLDLKGEKFKKVATTLTETLKNFPDYETCMSLLVTKVSKLADLKDVKQLLRQNLTLQYENVGIQFKKFVKIIQQDLMPIMIIRQPEVDKYHTQDHRKIIDSQEYLQFTTSFYEIVTKRLKNAQLPRLQAPGMSIEELKKCEPFANKVNENIQKISNSIIFGLKQSIRQVYNKIDLNSNLEKIDSQFLAIGKKKAFLKRLMNILSSKYQNKDQINERLTEIKRLFEQNGMQSEEFQNLKNQFIVIDFLSTLNLSKKLNQRLAWISYENVVGVFFNRIKNDKQFSLILQDLDKRLREAIKNKIKEQLRSCIKKQQPRQQFYMKWLNNIKTLPALYLKMTKYNRQKTDFLGYLNQIQAIYSLGNNQQCHQAIEPIKRLFQSGKENAKIEFRQEQMISSQAKPVVRAQYQSILDSNLKYRDYNEAQLNLVNYDVALDPNNQQLISLKTRVQELAPLQQRVVDLTKENDKLKNVIATMKPQCCCCEIM